jgi:hypothetical protein
VRGTYCRPIVEGLPRAPGEGFEGDCRERVDGTCRIRYPLVPHIMGQDSARTLMAASHLDGQEQVGVVEEVELDDFEDEARSRYHRIVRVVDFEYEGSAF